MLKLKRRLAAAVVVLGCVNFARADSITFQQGVSPSLGYNTGGVTIRTDQATNQNTGTQFNQIIFGQNGPNKLRGLLEFDLSGLLTAVAGHQYVINSASLTVNVFNAASGATTSGAVVRYDLDLLGNNLDFDETTVNWNNAPGGAGGSVGTNLSSVSYVANDTSRSSSFSELHTFSDTAAFRTALQNALDSDATIRFLLKAHDETPNVQNFTRIDSDEAVTPANNHIAYRPALTINYTVLTPLPVAATAGLVLMGGLGLRRTRRRA